MNIHFVGAGGIGLSGLAQFLQAEGHNVTGSDIRATTLTEKLAAKGIPVTVPHNASAVSGQDLLIHSAAVKPDNVELQAAAAQGIQTLSRKEALPMILKDKTVYSVCGAHGKSTTTAILASILPDCSTIIGAESKAIGSNVRHCDSDCLIFEADESDGSFLNSNPHCAIVTNAEPEHMEYYGHDLKRFHQAYYDFLAQANWRVINAEDPYLASLDLPSTQLYPSKDIMDVDFVLVDDEPFTRFTLKDLGSFDVWGFGQHIAIDASLAILAALERLELEKIRANLATYRGIKKRFDIIQKEGVVVIDDYAHHPTEIEATLNSIQQYAALMGASQTITAIWQPHKYSRTVDNLERFRQCFKGSNRLIILPVWAAGENAVEIDFAHNFDSYNLLLADRIKKENDRLCILRDDEVVDTLQEGIIVGFGAGDITYQLRGAC